MLPLMNSIIADLHTLHEFYYCGFPLVDTLTIIHLEYMYNDGKCVLSIHLIHMYNSNYYVQLSFSLEPLISLLCYCQPHALLPWERNVRLGAFTNNEHI